MKNGFTSPCCHEHTLDTNRTGRLCSKWFRCGAMVSGQLLYAGILSPPIDLNRLCVLVCVCVCVCVCVGVAGCACVWLRSDGSD